MANLFFNLPVPAANGAGAGVDVSQLGMSRTITVQGAFLGVVTIDGSGESIAGPWSPIVSFSNVSDEQTVNVAAPFMRVRRSGVPGVGIPGTPNVDVGGNDNGTLNFNVVAPAGNGVGASVNISTLGSFKTLYVTGVFSGTLTWEFSEDGTDWAQIKSFTTPGQYSIVFTAQFVRLRRSGVRGVAGLPDCAIAAVNDPASVFSGGGGQSLIYRPGSAFTGPVVFNDWADLYAQLLVLRANSNGAGLYWICFDSSLVSPAVVPAGTYDMLGCIWRGYGAGSSDSVSLADGVVLQNGPFEYQNNLTVVAVATTTPPVTIVTANLFQLSDGATVAASGAAGYFSGASLTAGQFATFRLTTVSSIGNGTVDSINFPVVGTTCLFSMGDQCGAAANAIDVAVGATFSPIYRSTSASINGTQPAMLGTLTVTDHVVDRWRTRTLVAGAAAAFGDQIGITPAGGGSVITLPAITAFSAGLPVSVKRLNAANALTITPAGGQTIDGQASLTLRGLQGVILVPDGPVAAGTNWRVISAFGEHEVWDYVASAATPLTAAYGQLLDLTPPGGGQILNLPAIVAADEGLSILVQHNIANDNTITITPAGGQTVGGAATYTLNLSGMGVLLVADGGTNWVAFALWGPMDLGSGVQEDGGATLIIKAANEMFFRRGTTDQAGFADAAFRPTGATASTIFLGTDVRRWGSFYKGAGEFVNVGDTKAVSGLLVNTEEYSIWDGANLTATLPANPDNGCKMKLKNLNVTALTVAASAGDAISAIDVTGGTIALSVAKEYVFRKSDRTWFVFSAA